MALSFDKTNFYDTGMTLTSLGLTQNATVAFWVKRSSTDVRCPIGNNIYTPGSNLDDSDIFSFFYVSGPWVRIVNASNTVATVNSGTWGTDYTHLAASYDGSNLKLFINGSYQAQTAITGNLKNTSSTERTWWIGRRGKYVNASWNWYGEIAEFCIWNVALTDSEIASLGKGFNANRIRPQSLKTNSRLIRTLADAKGASTASGTVTAAAHPRIY